MWKKIMVLAVLAIVLPLEALAASTVTTIADNVPMQSSYNSSKVIELIPFGTTFNTLDQSNGFYKVRYGNAVGWINSIYTNSNISGGYDTTTDLSPNSTFLDVAKARKQFVRDNQFYYQQANLYCPLNPAYSRTVDCSTFVCDVLYHYGKLKGLSGLQAMGRYSTYTYKAIGDGIKSSSPLYYNGVELTQYFSLVPSSSQLQPGDILLFDGHIEIYAGNGKVYSCGSTDSIQAKDLVTYKDSRAIVYIFRVK